mmetsp:Transcript_43310/g.130889  ORF Transcript_43310/g.130889 Transcript_43310/m.130889 type:complete len:203 (+) Transcript_43310:317-925(+)
MHPPRETSMGAPVTRRRRSQSRCCHVRSTDTPSLCCESRKPRRPEFHAALCVAFPVPPRLPRLTGSHRRCPRHSAAGHPLTAMWANGRTTRMGENIAAAPRAHCRRRHARRVGGADPCQALAPGGVDAPIAQGGAHVHDADVVEGQPHDARDHHPGKEARQRQAPSNNLVAPGVPRGGINCKKLHEVERKVQQHGPTQGGAQ